jgi:2-(1,2-epoxy-1,2-dihydrophenyl)acetyl-CoA isomerase
MTNDKTIVVDHEDGVAEITLNRPAVLNPLDLQAADELCEALGRIRREQEARAVLLRGAGRAFSAGGNLQDMRRALDGNPAEFFEAPLQRIHDAALALTRLPLPVVGALHGFVAGAGFNLALCCDLLLCSEETRFHQAFVRIGAVPDTGGTFLLPRRIGMARAMELFLLGDFVDADRALSFGLVNRVVPADDLLTAARALARRLAEGPTRAYAEIKQLALGATTGTLAESLDAERQAQLRIAATSDFREGVRAFFKKRKARFEGR